jgi:hypothetical protein
VHVTGRSAPVERRIRKPGEFGLPREARVEAGTDTVRCAIETASFRSERTHKARNLLRNERNSQRLKYGLPNGKRKLEREPAGMLS